MFLTCESLFCAICIQAKISGHFGCTSPNLLNRFCRAKSRFLAGGFKLSEITKTKYLLEFIRSDLTCVYIETCTSNMIVKIQKEIAQNKL